MGNLSYAQVRAAFVSRPIDLSFIEQPPASWELAFHADFSGYNDFFRILCRGLTFVDFPEESCPAHLDLFPGIEGTFTLTDKWRSSAGVPGKALMLWDADTRAELNPTNMYVICAHEIEFEAGADWHKVATPFDEPSDLRARLHSGQLVADELRPLLEPALRRSVRASRIRALLDEIDATFRDWPEPGRSHRLLRLLQDL